MDPTTIGRVLMGDSLGFHVIFALFAVGLPVLLCVGELWAIKTQNKRLRAAVKQWSFVALVIVSIALLSSLIIGLQFMIMWPAFMDFMLPVMGLAGRIGLGLLLLELLFLAQYVWSWESLSPTRHWLFSVLTAVCGLGAIFFLTTINAWMNSPAGFVLKDGMVTNINHVAAIFNPATALETSHSIFAYIVATTLIVTSIYAWLLFKKSTKNSDKPFYTYLVTRLSGLAVILALFVMLFGHLSAQYLAKYEPRKLAAMEIHTNTEPYAPLTIGGYLDEATGEVKDGVEIPYGLSILAGNHPATVVTGLNDFPREDWPPLVIHVLFGIKMAILAALVAVLVAVLFFTWLRRKTTQDLPRWLLPIVGLTGVFAVAIVELGWMLVEIGRQPYVINGYLLTKDAFTQSPGALQWGLMFPVLHIALFIATIYLILLTLKHKNIAKR